MCFVSTLRAKLKAMYVFHGRVIAERAEAHVSHGD